MKRKMPKQRNPFAQHAQKRHAGKHVKPYKTERAKQKQQLKNEVFK